MTYKVYSALPRQPINGKFRNTNVTGKVLIWPGSNTKFPCLHVGHRRLNPHINKVIGFETKL